MNQEDFFSQLIQGNMPARWAEQYGHFREHVIGDHLILLTFGCGCWRFIEVSVKYLGSMLGRSGIRVPGQRAMHTLSYIFPHGNVECGAKLADPAWLKRNLKVFHIELGYNHGYADHVFREHHNRLKTEALHDIQN